MQTKTCTKCKIEKSITEFSKDKSKKDGLCYPCKVCAKLYREANKEQIAATIKQWAQDNPEKCAANKKKWELANHEKRASINKRWREDNKEHCIASGREYRKTNPKYNNLYRQTPKGKAGKKASDQNRRSAKLNNGGKHTGKQILALFDLQTGACPYCKTKLNKSGKNKYHIDHIIPLSKGGSNDISNIQLLCPKCNLTKHDKLPEEFAAQFGKLL